MYPAALTAFGLIGNTYILGGQIKDVKNNLHEVKADIKDLIRRQTELGLHNMAQVEKLLMDCGKNK